MYTIEIKVEEVGPTGMAVTYQTKGELTPAETPYAKLVMAGVKQILDVVQKEVGDAGRIEGPTDTVGPLIDKTVDRMRAIGNN